MSRLRVGTLLVGLALVLSACTSSGGGESNTNQSPSEGGTIKLGGTLAAARAADAVTWDPAVVNENDSLWAEQQVEATLIRTTPDGSGFLPYVAKSWGISSDGLTYTFHLDPAAKFCDGSQITSADVIYSFQRETSKDAIVAWQFPGLEGMAAPESETVVLTLSQPSAAFLSYLTLWGTAIVSKVYGEKVGSQGLATKPLGSGPFCLENWQKGTEIDLTRNKYFWLKDDQGNRLPYLDAITWKIISDDNARVLAIQSGQVSVITPVPPSQFDQLSKSSDVVTGSSILLGTAQLYVSQRSDPCLKSVDVRQALNYAVDRDAIIKAVLFAHGTPATNPLYNANFSSDKYAYTYDSSKAKQLLAGSSCSNGFTATAYYVAGDTVAQQTLTILKSEWASLGVTLNLRALESGSFYNTWNAGNFDFIWNLGTNDIYDPAENLHFSMLPTSQHGSDSGFTGWSNPTVTKLVLEAETETDQAKRAQLYDEIQKLYMAEGPVVWLFSPQNLWATRSNVHGFEEYKTGAQSFMFTWMNS